MTGPRRFDLGGKAILVTGGGRGLGARIARAVAEHGADVAVASRKKNACDEVAAALSRDLGARAVGIGADVADEASVEAMLSEAERALGRVDGVVNNAGTSWGAPAEETPVAAWEKVFAVNARGAFLVSRGAARRWIAADRPGVVLNVASVAGLVGTAPEILDASAYSASKGAVVALTRDLAVKWARRGIRVNAIAPGFFETDMTRVVLERAGRAIAERTPLGRVGAEGEVEGAAVFLLSDAASYVTGAVLPVDGGLAAL